MMPLPARHPLHIAGRDDAAVPDAVAMLDSSGKHVGDGLDSPVRMPGKSRQIVRGHIIAEIVQQEERVELFCISETECAAEVHARTLESRFRFDKPFNRPD